MNAPERHLSSWPLTSRTTQQLIFNYFLFTTICKLAGVYTYLPPAESLTPRAPTYYSAYAFFQAWKLNRVEGAGTAVSSLRERTAIRPKKSPLAKKNPMTHRHCRMNLRRHAFHASCLSSRFDSLAGHIEKSTEKKMKRKKNVQGQRAVEDLCAAKVVPSR